ncbi:hypothetical protein MPLB_1820020 [Mesorhizobium sp. ORS 3324]|nr:hypothetical protein MPLB_1820020 [Mesorhizobium sp. ORS 3324]
MFAQTQKLDIEVLADDGRVNRVNGTQTHALAHAKSDSICLGFEPPPERQLRGILL